MARVGIIFGLLLCGVTLLGLVATASKSPTQFIPMMLGIPVLFCGVVSLNPHRRKYATRFTGLISSVGIVAGGMPMLASLVDMVSGAGYRRDELILSTTVTITCLILLTSCFVSVLNMRRRRMSGSPGQTVHLPPRNAPSSRNPNPPAPSSPTSGSAKPSAHNLSETTSRERA